MLNAAIETREVLTVAVGGTCLRGTYHKPHDASGLQACLGRRSRIGILFLNHGFLPRAAPGDSAVYWADWFANRGYPSFRFDLPGLGDSDGDVPAQMLDFVNAGGYAPTLSAAVKQLVERFGLSGVVIMGHCSGAVTALYTAAINKECKGVVLTDPYFFLPHERTKIREELTHWASWSRLGALTSNTYYYLKYIRLMLHRNRPPRNANLALLRCWNQLASAGMPILVLKAPALKARGLKPRIGEFDYLGYLQALSGRNSRVVIQFIEGTNHSFADAVGRVAIRKHTEEWLDAYFPTIAAANHPEIDSCAGHDEVVNGVEGGIGGPQALNFKT
jgi:pimeloyl-ACP methyl ester carboxylesterase